MDPQRLLLLRLLSLVDLVAKDRGREREGENYIVDDFHFVCKKILGDNKIMAWWDTTSIRGHRWTRQRCMYCVKCFCSLVGNDVRSCNGLNTYTNRLNQQGTTTTTVWLWMLILQYFIIVPILLHPQYIRIVSMALRSVSSQVRHIVRLYFTWTGISFSLESM